MSIVVAASVFFAAVRVVHALPRDPFRFSINRAHLYKIYAARSIGDFTQSCRRSEKRPVPFSRRGAFPVGFLRLVLLFPEHAALYAGGGEGAVAAEERAVGRLNVRLEFLAAFGEDFFGDDPVGISFFTFQSLSYTIDVYRRQITPLTSLLDYAFYVSFFPQLVAGPIVRARDFIPQIRRPLFVSNEMFGRGIFLIVSGLFKKFVISDYISVNFVERIFDNPTLYSGVENLIGVYGYALQIYCDFSGYSDMAIGIALLLGFHFNINFDSPYKSASITEFWRRWHISLSSWLRDYLYISLGGNRKGKIRQYANLIITMFLGGLWHGASWNFVLWGMMHGVALAAHKFWMTLTGRKKGTESHGIHRFFGVLVTFHFVCFCWIFFRNAEFSTSMDMLKQIFTTFRPQLFPQLVEGYWEVFALMALGYLLHFVPDSWERACTKTVIRLPLLGKAVLMLAVIYLVIQMKSSEIQPFIYFQF